MTQMFLTYIGAALTVSALIAVLALVRPLLQKRYHARLLSLLWLVLAVRLLLPVRFELPAAQAPVQLEMPQTEYVVLVDARHTPEYADLYKLRKEKIERVFADAKEKYGMRYTQYRGLTQVTNWVKLKFAAMNLKKLALWKWKRHGGKSSPSFSVILCLIFPTFRPMNSTNPTFA